MKTADSYCMTNMWPFLFVHTAKSLTQVLIVIVISITATSFSQALMEAVLPYSDTLGIFICAPGVWGGGGKRGALIRAAPRESL